MITLTVKKRTRIVYIGVISRLLLVLANQTVEELDIKGEENPQLKMRALFLNCEADDHLPSSDGARFQREELFKHNILTHCNKKMVLTVKITSETENSGDEYLPIEHVFEGLDKKSVRLLDPYILRLRRDPPLQAYKLRKLETVNGVLMNSADQLFGDKHNDSPRGRIYRDAGLNFTEMNDDNELNTEVRNMQSYWNSFEQPHQPQPVPVHTTQNIYEELNECDRKSSCLVLNETISKRCKRNERNIVVEPVTDDDPNWILEDHLNRYPGRDKSKHIIHWNDEAIEENIHKTKDNKENIHTKHVTLKNIKRKHHHSMDNNRNVQDTNFDAGDDNTPSTELRNSEVTNFKEGNASNNKRAKIKQKKSSNENVISSRGKEYAVYEVGSPELWHSVQVQLFSKLSTPDGKSVWNDLTKGKTIRVSSTSAEWKGQDLAVRYRSTRWIPRDEFSLPSLQLCLLVPSDEDADTYVNDNGTKFKGYKYSDFLVLPEEDIINVNKDIRRDDNNSDSESIEHSSSVLDEIPRKVMVRTSKAILNGIHDAFTIAYQGDEQFLTLKHRRPHHAQIDLEARADTNELIHVGSSGRISVVVSDCSRKTRTIINLQVGNTGLAAARFRIEARDFDPLLSELLSSKDTKTGLVLIPPRHTRSLRLELPIEQPVDVTHCSVALVNDEEQSVAVRNVLIKKADRCYCVWHCDCVCLGNDPKLMCHDMDETHQKAAGLSSHDRSRHTRSLSYQDDITLNLFVMFTGVLITLFLCGLIKAILGLLFRCIGTWGLHQLLQTPRKLDHYYEISLRNRNVKYDEYGWPVHPDTFKRNVHLVSMPMEFFLNTIFFITVPCLFIYDIVKQLFKGLLNKEPDCVLQSHQTHTKKCFSSQDIQAVMPRPRRRREGLQRWMSPQAQNLSTQLWEQSLNVHTIQNKDLMQPLLWNQGNVTQDYCHDSEQDDTDYVLTQMQKSRESLAKSQQKIIDFDTASAALNKHQTMKFENK